MCTGMTTMIVGVCIVVVLFSLLALEMFWMIVQLNIMKRPGRLAGQDANCNKNMY